jgi:hypothetical protein
LLDPEPEFSPPDLDPNLDADPALVFYSFPYLLLGSFVLVCEKA